MVEWEIVARTIQDIHTIFPQLYEHRVFPLPTFTIYKCAHIQMSTGFATCTVWWWRWYTYKHIYKRSTTWASRLVVSATWASRLIASPSGSATIWSVECRPKGILELAQKPRFEGRRSPCTRPAVWFVGRRSMYRRFPVTATSVNFALIADSLL